MRAKDGRQLAGFGDVWRAAYDRITRPRARRHRDVPKDGLQPIGRLPDAIASEGHKRGAACWAVIGRDRHTHKRADKLEEMAIRGIIDQIATYLQRS